MKSSKSFFTTAVIAAMVAIGPISTDMYLPAFPALITFFDTSIDQVQFTLSIFLIGFAVAQLLYGPLSDRFGRKPVLLVGITLFLFSSAAIIFVHEIEQMILLRFFQALGGSAGPVLGRAMVRDIHGAKDAARQLAYIGSAMALAPAIAPVIGGYFTIWWGWESSFVFLTMYAIAVFLIVAIKIPETAPPGSHHVLSMNNLIKNYLSLLKHATWPWYTLTCSFVFSGLFSFLSGSSFVIIEFLGFGAEQFGLFFTIIVVGYMIGAMTGARLLHHHDINTIISRGAILASVSGSVLAVLALLEFHNIYTIIIPQFFYMMAVGFVMPQAMAGALGPFAHMAGTASAFLGFIQMSFAAIVGVMVGQFHDGTPASMSLSIALMGILTLLSYLKLSFSIKATKRAEIEVSQ